MEVLAALEVHAQTKYKAKHFIELIGWYMFTAEESFREENGEISRQEAFEVSLLHQELLLESVGKVVQLQYTCYKKLMRS